MKNYWRGKANRSQRERGIMIAIAALGFASFLFAAGLAVDVSNWYAAGTELQNAADAAAMAGATALDSTSNGLDRAVARATGVANSYNFNLSSVNIPAANVTFAANITQFDNNGAGWDLATAKHNSNFPKVRFVRVQLSPTSVKVYIAGAALGGVGSINFLRRAVAGQSASGFTAPGTANDPGIKSITNMSRLVLVEDDTGSGTLSVAGSCANNKTYTKGCTYNINMTPPCDALSATYEVLDGDTGSAGSNLNKQMVIPMSGCYSANHEHDVNTHPQSINIRSGLNTVFNEYSDTTDPAFGTALRVAGISSTEGTTFPPDTNIKESSGGGAGNYSYAHYKAGTNAVAPTGRPGVAGRRVLIVGIMKKSSWWIDPADPLYETATLKTYKYGAFFLKKRPTTSGRIQLEYIGDRVIVPGAGTCDSSTTTTMTTTQSSDMTSGLSAPVLYR